MNDLNELRRILISSKGTRMVAQLETQSHDQERTGLMGGVNKDESTATFAARGIFETDAAARAEALAMIPQKGSSPGRSGSSNVGQGFDTINPTKMEKQR